MQFLTEEIKKLLDTKVSGNNQTSQSIISFRMAARIYPEIFRGTINSHTEKEYDEYRLYASRCLIIAASEAHRHIVQDNEERKGNRKVYWERPSLPPAPVTQDSPIRSTYHAAACARGKRGERSFAHMVACVDWSFVRYNEDNFRPLIDYDILVSSEESIKELPLDALDNPKGRLPITFRNLQINSGYEPYWQFWRDWYQGFLDGKPLDWNLQREVALIPDADWDKGPAHIADKIEEIKARFLIEKAALSEKIDFNPETQKFYVTPTPIANPRLLSTNLTLISDALDEAMRGNGLRPDCWEDRTLRKTVKRFADDPERIEMDCMRVHRRLIAKLGNELPESDELVDLAATLLDVALDIRANHPDIAENRAKRGAQAVREASADEKALLEDAIPYIRAITDENLGQQIEDDIGEILEGVGLTAPEDLAVTVDPVARTGSRLAKIWLNVRKLDEAIKREITEAAETSKEILCIGGAIAMLYSVWPIFLKFLGF